MIHKNTKINVTTSVVVTSLIAAGCWLFERMDRRMEATEAATAAQAQAIAAMNARGEAERLAADEFRADTKRTLSRIEDRLHSINAMRSIPGPATAATAGEAP